MMPYSSREDEVSYLPFSLCRKNFTLKKNLFPASFALLCCVAPSLKSPISSFWSFLNWKSSHLFYFIYAKCNSQGGVIFPHSMAHTLLTLFLYFFGEESLIRLKRTLVCIIKAWKAPRWRGSTIQQPKVSTAGKEEPFVKIGISKL